MNTVMTIDVTCIAPQESFLANHLQTLLAHMHVVYALHRSAHWQSHGETSFSDHTLFQRMYEPIIGEIDTLAERIVVMFGPGYVDADKFYPMISEGVQQFTCEFECPFDRVYSAEYTLITLVQECMTMIDESEELTIGWEDFLGAVASQHEENMYLLDARLH